MTRKREALWVLAITAIAVAVRFYGIQHLPPGLHFDEAFENVVVSDRPWPDPDEDWMPGEFDIV